MILNNQILKTEMVEWKKLTPFQPDNLKKTEPHKLQKLANSLCENGFQMNFYVWEQKDKIYIIDGHSRQEILTLLESGAIRPRKDGKEYDVQIPDRLPCSFLSLKNKQEAKKAILIFNSHYKSIAQDVLQDFVSDMDLDEIKSQIEIPELNFDSLDYSDKNKEIDVNEFGDEMVLKFKYNEDDYMAVKGTLAKINESPEKALLELLNL